MPSINSPKGAAPNQPLARTLVRYGPLAADLAAQLDGGLRGRLRALGHRAVPLLAGGRQEPKYDCDENQCGYISDEVPMFISVIDGLCSHDSGMN